MKTRVLLFSFTIIFLMSCSQEDSLNQNEDLNAELELIVNQKPNGDDALEETIFLPEQLSKNSKNNRVDKVFLDDGSGIPIDEGQDCSLYRPLTAGYRFCAFKVYFNTDILTTPEQIDCMRKEYFESNPKLRLVNGPQPPLGTNSEWWIFTDCGLPTGGTTPVNGSNEDVDTDSRVCVRNPCE